MVMSEGAGEGWMQERGLDHWRVAVERHGDVAGLSKSSERHGLSSLLRPKEDNERERWEQTETDSASKS